MLGSHYECRACLRRPLGSHRIATAKAASEAQGRPPSRTRPRRAWWGHLRAPNGLSVALAAQGPRQRQRHHLLETAARLAGRRGLGAAAYEAVELAGRRGRHRLVAGERGFIARAGQKGGDATRPNPTDRGKPGSKYHLVVDRNGIPLAVHLSAANVHDARQLLPLVDAIPPIIGPRGKPGRPRKRPAKLHPDKAYASSDLRRALRARGITPRIARRGSTPPSGWDDIAGWWSARFPGCSATADSGCVTSGGRISCRGCSTWPAPCFAFASSARWRRRDGPGTHLRTRSAAYEATIIGRFFVASRSSRATACSRPGSACISSRSPSALRR